MLWLLVLAVALVGAVVALLAVPVEVAFDVERRERARGEVALRWLFFRKRVRFPSARAREKAQTRRERRAARKERKGREGPTRRGRRRPKWWAALSTPGFPSRALALLRDVLDATHPHELRLRVLLGTGDPAETGRLWAVLGPVSALLSSVQRADLSLEPDFVEERLVVLGRGELFVVPLQLLALLLVFALSPTTVRAAFRTVRS